GEILEMLDVHRIAPPDEGDAALADDAPEPAIAGHAPRPGFVDADAHGLLGVGKPIEMPADQAAGEEMRIDQHAMDEDIARRLEDRPLGQRLDAALPTAVAERQIAHDHGSRAGAGDHGAVLLEAPADD